MEVTPFIIDYGETAEMADEVVGEEMARNERGRVARGRGRGVGKACPGRGRDGGCLMLKETLCGDPQPHLSLAQAFWYFLWSRVWAGPFGAPTRLRNQSWVSSLLPSTTRDLGQLPALLYRGSDFWL